MKALLLISSLVMSFSVFASGTFDLKVLGTDQIGAKELFNVTFAKQSLGKKQKIEVNDTWSGAGNGQKLVYNVRTGFSPVKNGKVVVQAVVTDIAAATPVELYKEEKSVDVNLGETVVLEFNKADNGVMLNHKLQISTNKN